MSKVTESSNDLDDEEEDSSFVPRRKRRKPTNQQDKETRQAEARAEAAQLARDRRERKHEEARTKKAKASESKSAPFDPDAPIIGFCDICQMSEKYKKNHMKLWRCKECGVHVHDRCYCVSNKKMNKPNPNFKCWACQSVGHSFKVRDRDPFTNEYLEIKQKHRPTECCLCSVDDGIHAMHPVYDCHGPKGRQIYLAAEEGKPRRLAWAHTLCALTVNVSNEARSSIYGCAPDGWYDNDDLECELLSDSESVNTDLERDGRPTGTHHFVYWGYLHAFLEMDPKKWDAWAKSIPEVKKKLRCSICGKKDNKKITLPGGQSVYQSLRVPIQCCANNEDEAPALKEYHKKGGDPCYTAVHVGCAMWGRNDDGEYSRARSSWFFPGFNEGGALSDPVVEVYCKCHSEEMFQNRARGSDMSNKLPGPFAPIAGMDKKKAHAEKAAKLTSRQLALADSHSHGSSRSSNVNQPTHNVSSGQTSRAAKVASRPEALSPPPAATHQEEESELEDSSDDEEVAKRPGKKGRLKKKKQQKVSLQPQSKSRPSETKSKKRAPNPKKAANSIMHNVSLHGETTKKRAKEMTKAGEAVTIQTKMHGRLVSSKRNSSALSQGSSCAVDQAQNSDLKVVQDVLNNLVKRKKEFNAQGKPFDTAERARLRLQLHKTFSGTKLEFDKAWFNANEAFNDGIFDITVDSKSTEHPGNGDTMMQGSKAASQSSGKKTESAEEKTQSTEEKTQRHSNAHGTEASPNNTPVPKNDSGTTLMVEKIVNDILKALESEGQTQSSHSLDQVRQVLKERKKYWHKQIEMSKAEWKVFFHVKIAESLEEVSGWLQITGKQPSKPEEANDGNNLQKSLEVQEATEQEIPSQEATEDFPMGNATLGGLANLEDNSNQPTGEELAVEEPSTEQVAPEPASKPLGRRKSQDIPRHGASFEEEKREVTANNDHNGIPAMGSLPQQVWPLNEYHQSHATSQPPSRWSFLHYGPYYRKEGFRFDKWDTMEEIDQMSSDEEERGHEEVLA